MKIFVSRKNGLFGVVVGLNSGELRPGIYQFDLELPFFVVEHAGIGTGLLLIPVFFDLMSQHLNILTLVEQLFLHDFELALLLDGQSVGAPWLPS